ncbi:MAG: hypothetical protein ACRCVN_03320 [Spirochaetia bacterium]
MKNLEKDINDIKILITKGFSNIGICPDTGKKINGVFTWKNDIDKRLEVIEKSLEGNITTKSLYRFLTVAATIITSLGALVGFLVNAFFRGQL